MIKMEHYQISKLFSDSAVSKFVTRTCIKINDLLSGQYSLNKSIKFKTSMLRSDLCDYIDAYIVVKDTLTLDGDNDDKTRNKNLIFKNKAPFRSSISKIKNMFIDSAKDLDNVMSM